jgi:ribosomal-protein-alanine N-acetyltransferase
MHIIYQSPKIIIREFLPEEKQTFLNLFKDKLVTQYLIKTKILADGRYSTL